MTKEIVPMLVSVKDTKMDEKWKTLAPILGKVQDTLIAECYGVSRELVRQKRERLGIPPFNISTGRRSLAEKYNISIEDLKNMSGEGLRKKYSVSMAVVHALKQKYGITHPKLSIYHGKIGVKRKKFIETYKQIVNRAKLSGKKYTVGQIDQMVSERLKITKSAAMANRLRLGFLSDV